MTTLLELPVEAGTTIASPGHKAPQLLLQSEGKYHLFALLDQTESEDWFDPLPELEGFVTLANTRPLPPLKLRATATMPALPKEFAMAASITITAKGKLVTTARGVSAYATFDPRGDRQWQVTEYISPDTVPAGVESVMVASMIPYGLAAFGYGLFALSNLAAGRAAVSGAYLTNLETIVVIVAVTTLVAIVLGAATFLLCRRRGLSRQASLWWIVVSLFLGLATPLAIVAIYPKLVREPCSGCQRQRRVDHDKCSHCGAEWSPPPTAGIELLEGQALVAHAHPHPV